MLTPRYSWLVVIPLAASAGCYDTHAIVSEVRTAALRAETNEINLGFYRTTLPRDPATHLLTEIELRLFGTTQKYKIPIIEKQLQADGYRLRSDTLMAIRQTTPEELTEADLGQLRSRLLAATNQVLAGAPIQSLGVKSIRIIEKR